MPLIAFDSFLNVTIKEGPQRFVINCKDATGKPLSYESESWSLMQINYLYHVVMTYTNGLLKIFMNKKYQQTIIVDNLTLPAGTLFKFSLN